MGNHKNDIDPEAILRQYKRLINQMTARFPQRGACGHDDVFQEGCIGALTAAERHDKNLSTLMSYMCCWIRAKCSRFWHKNRTDVHVPAYVLEAARKWMHIKCDLQP